jgi:hypothetical protein
VPAAQQPAGFWDDCAPVYAATRKSGKRTTVMEERSNILPGILHPAILRSTCYPTGPN